VRRHQNLELAVSVRDVGGQLGGLGTAVVSGVGIARGPDAGLRDRGSVKGGGIAVVRVDTGEGGAAGSLDLREEGRALVLSAAVSAAPVQFAESLDTVRVNLDGPSTVVLDDFVFGVLGAAADDVGLAGGLLDGDSVLAYILEPDVVEIAGAKAVDTLSLVSADDDILNSRATLDEENGVGVTAFVLFLASTATTVVPDISTVEGGTSGDGHRLGKRRCLGRRGEGARGGTSDDTSFLPLPRLESRRWGGENRGAESSSENSECERDHFDLMCERRDSLVG